MSLPTGWSINPVTIRAKLAAGAVHIDYQIISDADTQVGGGTYTVTRSGATATDVFSGDGTTTAFTTKEAVYGGALYNVLLAGTAQTAGFTTAAAVSPAGGVIVTFATAPAEGTAIGLNYPTGPGLLNAAGNLVTALGLSTGTGTVYSGTVGGAAVSSSFEQITDLAALLAAWAAARIEADVF